MIRPLMDFVSQFNAELRLDENLVVKKGNRYFLLNEKLKDFTRRGFFYAGIYLGETKNGRFFPSISLLKMIVEKAANKIVIDRKTEWLFICGRDIFRQGIIKASGSRRKGSFTLVLNIRGECLGFGEITRNLDDKGVGVYVKNIFDIGDFLRREKRES
jgi:ribosome biogenesis protein Nip4